MSFSGNEFSRSHRKLCTSSYTFWTFTVGVYELVPGLSLEGDFSIPYYYPTQVFFFHFMQQYDFFTLRLTVPCPLINHQLRCSILTMHSHHLSVRTRSPPSTRPDSIGGSEPDPGERGPHYHFQSKYKKKSIQI